MKKVFLSLIILVIFSNCNNQDQLEPVQEVQTEVKIPFTLSKENFSDLKEKYLEALETLSYHQVQYDLEGNALNYNSDRFGGFHNEQMYIFHNNLDKEVLPHAYKILGIDTSKIKENTQKKLYRQCSTSLVTVYWDSVSGAWFGLFDLTIVGEDYRLVRLSPEEKASIC